MIKSIAQTMRAAVLLLSSVLLIAVTNGCATVKPWQRESLADPMMQPDRNALAASQLNHAYFAREAASGGSAVGGSGCGCNN
jgi:hypothetical protein